MKILIDVMGNPSQSGGMHLYAHELVSAWAESFPGDELHVVGGTWVDAALKGFPNVVPHTVSGGSVVHRFWVQTVWSGLLARKLGCRAVLSLSAIGAFTFPRDKTFVVVHDWRHVKRPTEFGRAQLLYRKLWKWSVRRASTTVVISKKTAAETVMFARPRSIATVPNGGDHPRRWIIPPQRDEGGPSVLTYGHFVNKRPEAVIKAIDLLVRSDQFEDGVLTVVGAKGAYREDLRNLVAALGVDDHVRLPGFLSDADYQSIFQCSDVVVLNSSDEGYGLPVVEAAYFSIPVVGATDSGLSEIHGDGIVESEPTPAAIAAAIAEQLTQKTPRAATSRSWANCAADIRRVVGI